MKKIFAILLIVAMSFSFAACNSGAKNDAFADATETKQADISEKTDTMAGKDASKRVLVAYFSATGNTKKAAKYAAESLDADLYEIVPTEPYTSDDLNYSNEDCRAKREMEDESFRPEISKSVENMEQYDIVFIGYPIWWGEAPRIVSTFVESYIFSDKTVVTFCTSGSSANNDSALKSLVSSAEWITGARFGAGSSQSDIAGWIDGLALDFKK